MRIPNLLQPLRSPSFVRAIKDYEVIHAGGSAASFLMGISKKLICGRTVYDIHGHEVAEFSLCRDSVFDLPGNYRIVESMITEHIAFKRSDFFIACSERLRQLYLRKGVDQGRIELIRNGVDTEFFRPGNGDARTGTFAVTYAGAFQRWQGIDNLVSAARSLRKLDITFRIIGFTRRDVGLKREISRTLGNKAELFDKMPQAELIRYLQQSDVVIIPRHRHPATEVGFPTKFPEYLAVGKPVIVTRVDETSDFVERFDCGFVCEPTAECIAHTIRTAQETSEEALVRKGLNGRRLAQTQFDWRVIGKTYFEFLSRMGEER